MYTQDKDAWWNGLCFDIRHPPSGGAEVGSCPADRPFNEDQFTRLELPEARYPLR